MINLTTSDIDNLSALMKKVGNPDGTKVAITVDRDDRPVLTNLDDGEMARLMQSGKLIGGGYHRDAETRLWEFTEN